MWQCNVGTAHTQYFIHAIFISDSIFFPIHNVTYFSFLWHVLLLLVILCSYFKVMNDNILRWQTDLRMRCLKHRFDFFFFPNCIFIDSSINLFHLLTPPPALYKQQQISNGKFLCEINRKQMKLYDGRRSRFNCLVIKTNIEMY